ncbi:uncharacterized protein EAF01_010021 [Botrytis porri]|uniref:uncharacterized protein n=1 Tax=Botrytis porri TaxID=87229 RepID=UPI0019010F4B|nr:uncharacterized protein EAF01_010021 [Botrytis porri]KAF7894570.1 hypothetical protein EAF01_010021 [Botrytis porri]
MPPTELQGRKLLSGFYTKISNFNCSLSRTQGSSPTIVMKLNFERIKQLGGKKKEKIFAFYKAEDLAYCRTCGYKKRLEFHDLRRASGKKLNEIVTPEERRQIISHHRDVYKRYYMPAFVNTNC